MCRSDGERLHEEEVPRGPLAVPVDDRVQQQLWGVTDRKKIIISEFIRSAIERRIKTWLSIGLTVFSTTQCPADYRDPNGTEQRTWGTGPGSGIWVLHA